jgi:uncharacterized protein YhbP (UPF0306 family)
MGIARSKRPLAVGRIEATARQLLDASPLCAIATVAAEGRAYVNNAYFASSPGFDLVWLSEPRARHSRNVRANGSAAIAVYDPDQKWGTPDRGVQLFGVAEEVPPSESGEAETLYAARFPDARDVDLSAYRFYVFRPRRIELFDEQELGAGVFVTARVERGRLSWEKTEIYRAGG